MSIPTDSPFESKPTRRWPRYSLRTAFIVLTLACIWLGWEAKLTREQKAAVAAVRSVSGTVHYTYQLANNGSFDESRQPAAPKWLRELIGEDFFITVCDVSLYNSSASQTFVSSFTHQTTAIQVTDELLAHIQRLPRLRSLFIHSVTPDAGLEAVGTLTQLESLNYAGITDAGMAHLTRLPNLKTLHLSGQLSDHALVELTHFQRLESIYLFCDGITDSGLVYLECLPALKLVTLQNFGSDLSPAGMARLQQALPRVRLTARVGTDMKLIYRSANGIAQ